MVIDGDVSPGASRDARPPNSGVARLQRERILDAEVEVVAEDGAGGASVELVIARASVSRRTFYEHFGGLDECLVAVLDRGLERVGSLAAQAFEGAGSWQDGMRLALAAVLGFFDEEPQLARVCMVETLAGGALVGRYRERINDAFRALVVARIRSEVSHPSPLAPEAVLGSVMGIVNARLIARGDEPLLGLLGPLMGVIVGPFMDEEQVAREIERGNELAAARLRRGVPGTERRAGGVEVPAALLAPRAHRVRLCLLYVAAHPGASNHEVGAGIGVAHRGQVTKLLGRLAALGLLVKRAGAPGRPNQWSATPAGERVALALAGGSERGERADR